MVEVMKSNTFWTGTEARSCVEAAIYAGSKEPALRTEVRGFHPSRLKTIYGARF